MRRAKYCSWVTFASIMFVLGTFAAAFGQAASSYTFTTIDVPLPTRQFGFTSLEDINEEGQITGGFTDSNLGPRGFLLNFKKKVHSTEIRCSGKDVVSIAPLAINGHGEIAGFAVIVERVKIPRSPSKIFITKISGFFRDRRGKCTILEFPGAKLTEAVGVNNDGQVVGDYEDAHGIFHGFFWDDGQFLTIDVPFPEARLTAATGINNIGQIVGFYFDNNQAHGFLYDNGSFTSFDFPEAVATFPVDLNDNGQIVGTFAADNDLIGRSFLIDAGRFSTFDLPFSGVVATQVSGINNSGQIVGRYIENNPSDPVNPFPSHGFIATPAVHSLLAKFPQPHAE